MNVWSPEREPRRYKRPFSERSQSATLSPSPMTPRDPTSASFFSNAHYLSPPANNEPLQPTFLDRRRTSHPHNQPLQRGSEDMSQPQRRPRFEDQSSIIDLTDDAEDPVASRERERSRSHRPPQLGRSDAVGFGDFVDLTDDGGDPDIIITGGRELSVPRPILRRNTPAAQGRAASPSLFMPLPPHHHIHRVFANHNEAGAVGVILGGVGRAGPSVHMNGHLNIGRMQDFMNHVHLLHHANAPQAMPGHMDYGGNAFAQRKAEHVPPPAARQDFTRSPKEDDMIICPSCEQELVHRKDVGEPVVKKGGRALSRKDREEHPFWVVKECGHVYCNSCYQNRTPIPKQPVTTTFREIAKSGKGRPTKVQACAVDGCESEIKSKDKWVGVFL